MRIYLISNKLDIKATQEEKYDFVINIAAGLTKFESIVEWLTKHVVKNSG